MHDAASQPLWPLPVGRSLLGGIDDEKSYLKFIKQRDKRYEIKPELLMFCHCKPQELNFFANTSLISSSPLIASFFNMSTINIVRFFRYSSMHIPEEDMLELVRIAYQAARDRRIFPKEILIRSAPAEPH